ncbi:hypothetical protein RhiirC2_798944 [Rhizophagus irregularis]|uniref:Uncharacterized protein n=1 Tax=Rhizophagus irregularis TaxID=588596 RepID=A0A2N1M5P7_9GLOM|nr:hypothetical protein RhiirC2_798944 [Rhizophagus irregularis]
MDTAMEQTIGFQGRTLSFDEVHPMIQKPFATDVVSSVVLLPPALKERFNIGQRPAQQRTPRNNSRSRSRSKSQNRSASAQRSNSNSNSSNNNNNNHHNNHINPSSSGSTGLLLFCSWTYALQ